MTQVSSGDVLHAFFLFRKGYESKVSSLDFVLCRQLKVLSVKSDF